MVTSHPPERSDDITYESIHAAINGETSDHFWASIDENGNESYGNERSYFAKNPTDEELTFDVSNNRVLANVNLNGTIKDLTVYHDDHQVDSIPGVWFNKEYTQTGPLSFRIETDDREIDLSDHGSVAFCKTELLENAIPMSVLRAGNLEVTLLTYTPISADGSERPPVAFYGVHVASESPVEGTLSIPFSGGPEAFSGILEGDHRTLGGSEDTSTSDPDAVSFSVSPDASAMDPHTVSFSVSPDESEWFPVVIAPEIGPETIDLVECRSSLEWLNETLTYFRRMVGSLETPQDPFLRELFERLVYLCFNSLAIGSDGQLVGSNWGSYPATTPIWMKDCYHSLVPFALLEPDLLKKGIEWFSSRSVRPEGAYYEGGISHSLPNALSPVVLAGLYYGYTGDRKFFLNNPGIVDSLDELVDRMLTTRINDTSLFESYWLSDGPTYGDYNTCTNLLAWLSLQSMGDIHEGVYGNSLTAERLYDLAARVRRDIENHCVIENPTTGGSQYVEGTNADGTCPSVLHDGEETDTALMPFYGYTAVDDPRYKETMRAALSSDNPIYNQTVDAIEWGVLDAEEFDRKNNVKAYPNVSIGEVDAVATAPSYVTGFASVTDADDFEREFSKLRRRTDIDGSFWWWPYPLDADDETEVDRAHDTQTGKCGWAAGTYVSLFVSDILGLDYDAKSRTVTHRPFSPTTDYTWSALTLGEATLDVAFRSDDERSLARIRNRNSFQVTADVELPLEGDDHRSVRVNGTELSDPAHGEFFEWKTVRVQREVAPYEEFELVADYG